MPQNSVTLSLGPSYTVEVHDIIMNPSAERAYETLKVEMIKRLSLSQKHKTRRLLEHEEIEDRNVYVTFVVSPVSIENSLVELFTHIYPAAFSSTNGRYVGSAGGHCEYDSRGNVWSIITGATRRNYAYYCNKK